MIFDITEGFDEFLVHFDASYVGMECALMKHGKVVVYALGN